MVTPKRPRVLLDVITAVEAGLLIPSLHATEQMLVRDIQMSDVEEMIYQAQREEEKDSLTRDRKNWKYALRGFNESKDKDIRIIVIFVKRAVVIVTVIDKNK